MSPPRRTGAGGPFARRVTQAVAGDAPGLAAEPGDAPDWLQAAETDGAALAESLDGPLADAVRGLLADAALSGGPMAQHVLGLHLARFFAAGGAERGATALAPGAAEEADGAMTPHFAGPRGAAGVPPFVAPDREEDRSRGSALDVPAHMHGDIVRSLGLALLAELGTDGPFSRHAAATLAEALAARFAIVTQPAVEPRPMARGGLAPHILRRVTERMANDLAEELDLPTLAAEARLSPWHFARAFKQSTGEPPHTFRTRLRIEHAKALLAGTDEPVMAIAEAVGYDSAQSLARAFRKLTGVSPSAWRRTAAG